MVGDIINIDKMINMLLISLSKNHNIFYLEKRTYKENKICKTFNIKIDNIKEEFRSKRDLLIYLSKRR